MSGQADSVTIVPVGGLQDRLRHLRLAGAFSREEGCDPPTCWLAPQLSQGLQEAADIQKLFPSPPPCLS